LIGLFEYILGDLKDVIKVLLSDALIGGHPYLLSRFYTHLPKPYEKFPFHFFSNSAARWKNLYRMI
jgi:hypothetical protein